MRQLVENKIQIPTKNIDKLFQPCYYNIEIDFKIEWIRTLEVKLWG